MPARTDAPGQSARKGGAARLPPFFLQAVRAWLGSAVEGEATCCSAQRSLAATLYLALLFWLAARRQGGRTLQAETRAGVGGGAVSRIAIFLSSKVRFAPSFRTFRLFQRMPRSRPAALLRWSAPPTADYGWEVDIWLTHYMESTPRNFSARTSKN